MSAPQTQEIQNTYKPGKTIASTIGTTATNIATLRALTPAGEQSKTLGGMEISSINVTTAMRYAFGDNPSASLGHGMLASHPGRYFNESEVTSDLRFAGQTAGDILHFTFYYKD